LVDVDAAKVSKPGFQRLGAFAMTMISSSAFVHPKAEVSPDCEIGAGTRVWQFASVIRGARIGEGCNIASGACIDGSRIGNRCVIGHNLAMGPGFLIGDDVFIGPNVTFCNDAWPRARKDGFDASKFDGAFHWAVIVERGASIGAGSVILPGVRIGRGAMIAANSTVTRDVEPHTIWIGDGETREIVAEPGRRMRFADEEVRGKKGAVYADLSIG
jgi:acetyltransferase-like isoleucine patch superfamily enzyme